MMMTMTIPRFVSATVSAGSKKPESGAAGGVSQPGNAVPTTSTQTWGSASSMMQTQGGGDVGSSDPLDFDILAEYLLDEGGPPGGLGTFDFSSETPPTTSEAPSAVVSPDQLDTSFVGDAASQVKKEAAPAPSPTGGNLAGDLAQVQQMIAAHAAAAEQRISAAPGSGPAVASVASPAAGPAAAPAPVLPAPPVAVVAPPAPTGAPAAPLTSGLPGVPMPAVPTASPYPTIVAPGVPVSAVAAPPVHPQHVQHVAVPAPGAVAVAAPAPTSLAPATTSTSHKRRRSDAPAPSPAAFATAPVGAIVNLNGQLMTSVTAAVPPRGGRQKTQAQIDRRRERNRILARRTRLRKKFFFESLQKDVIDLQRENSVLKDIVRSRLNPEVAKSIIDDCRANEQLPSVVAEHCGQTGSDLDRQDFNLVQSIQKSQQCFVITDPSLQDNPIVYASEDFLTLTGYSRDEVLGRNCRFLQGTETSPAKVSQIKKAVENGEDCSVTIINYTSDGTAFWNKLFIAALRDAQNNIVNFIGVIVKVAAPEPGDPEAGKKIPCNTSTPDVVMGGGSAGNVADGGPVKCDEEAADSATNDAAEVAKAADGTVAAIEGAVTAAVAAAPNVVPSTVASAPVSTA